MKKRQPLSESDYEVLIEAISSSLNIITDSKRVRRLTVLSKRLGEFKSDLASERKSHEWYAREDAARTASEPERRLRALELAKKRFLEMRRPDERAVWAIYAPDQNFDLHGGPHGRRHLQSMNSTWKEVVDAAFRLCADYLGEPIIEKVVKL